MTNTTNVATSTQYAYMTADAVVYDGGDTNMYGDETEPGHGCYMENGWVDPDWSMTQLYDEPTDPFATYDPEFDGTVSQWQHYILERYLGAWHDDGGSGETYYAQGFVTPDYGTGTEYHYAIHFRSEPFATDAE